MGQNIMNNTQPSSLEIPPANGRCYINELPPELLANIFELGVEMERSDGDEWEDVDDDDEAVDSDSPFPGSRKRTLNDVLHEEEQARQLEEKVEREGNGVGPSSSSSSKPQAEEKVEVITLPEEGDGKAGSEAKKLPFEILVSHVCKLWRDIALSLPTLWTQIEFREKHKPPYAKALAYISRSKNAPLDISIDFTLDEDDDDDDDDDNDMDFPGLPELKMIGDIVLPHVEHWRSFELLVDDYHLMHPVLLKLGQCPSAPILETLLLYCHEETELDEFYPPEFKEQDFVLFHGNAPNLTHVSLWGVHLKWEESLTFLHGLEDLELAYHTEDVRPSYRQFQRMLMSSPKLEVLSLKYSGPRGGPVDWLESVSSQSEQTTPVEDGQGEQSQVVAAPSTQITLPVLTELLIECDKAPWLTALFERISMPRLHTLALDLEGDDFTEFVNFLTRPSSTTSTTTSSSSSTTSSSTRKPLLSNILHLKITDLPCSDSSIEKIIDALDSVSSLNLNFNYLPRTWAYLLQGYGANGNPETPTPRLYLPKLQTLTTRGLDGNEVLGIVKTRHEKIEAIIKSQAQSQSQSQPEPSSSSTTTPSTTTSSQEAKSKSAYVPLKRVQLEENDDITTEEEEELRKCGVEVEVFEGSDDEVEDEDGIFQLLEMDGFDEEDVDDFDDEEEDEQDEEDEDEDEEVDGDGWSDVD
ncbi:hypothetical protein K474DRAFT_318657 [Panus rudis PR-1116 ss-1]|nr:hypothetical protein K474DRAFT_318657 [Panus rudis PR-1116 ss-1]